MSTKTVLSCAPDDLFTEMKFLDRALGFLFEEYWFTGSLAMIATACYWEVPIQPVDVQEMLSYITGDESSVSPKQLYTRPDVKDIDVGVRVRNGAQFRRMVQWLNKCSYRFSRYSSTHFDLSQPTYVFVKDVYVNLPAHHLRDLDMSEMYADKNTIRLLVCDGAFVQQTAAQHFFEQAQQVFDNNARQIDSSPRSFEADAVPSLLSYIVEEMIMSEPVQTWSVPILDHVKTFGEMLDIMDVFIKFECDFFLGDGRRVSSKTPVENGLTIYVMPKKSVVLDVLNIETTNQSTFIPRQPTGFALFQEQLPILDLTMLIERKVDAFKNEPNNLKHIYDLYLMQKWLIPIYEEHFSFAT